MKKILYLKYILVLVSALVVFSCDDSKTYDVVGNEGCVYVRELKGSEQYPATGNIATVPAVVMGETELKFPVRSTMPVKSDINVQFVIDDSMVEAYNEKHGTQYKTLDNRFYKVENLSLRIVAGNNKSKDSLYIWIPKEEYRNVEAGDYMIAVRMDKVSGYLAATSLEENKKMFFIMNVIHSDSNLKPDDSIDGNLVEDCTGWSAEYSLEYTINDWTNEGVNSINTAMFDHIQNTCIQPVTYTPEDCLLVDMGKIYSNIYTIDVSYSLSGWAHTAFTLYTSVDNKEWIEQGHVSVGDRTYNKACTFYAPLEARYLKIVGDDIWYNYGNYLYFAGVDIYVK